MVREEDPTRDVECSTERNTLINITLEKTGGHHMTSLVTDAVLTFHC